MPKKKKKDQEQKPRKKMVAKCENCIHLYSRHGKKGPCWDTGKTKKLSKRACKFYKAGAPFTPSLDGKLAKAVDLDPDKPHSFVFYLGPKLVLVLAWTQDHVDRWHWKIKLIGIKPGGGLYKKKFTSRAELASFFGEIEILGPGANSLFRSFSFEDIDEKDEEGNVVNKPREIRIYPTADRKGMVTHGRKRQS